MFRGGGSKKVNEAPWYISNFGRVKTIKGRCGGWLRTASTNNSGYLFVNYNNKNHYLHRLVAHYFINPIPKGMVVNHKDGNKTNNHVNNLEIITYKENTRHAYDNGLMTPLHGQENSMSKLTNIQAKNLISDILNGLTNSELALKYGLHDRYISLVRHKKRWKKLWSEFGTSEAEISKGNDKNKSLTPEQFVVIVNKIRIGYTNAAIEREYGLSSGTCSRIRNKKLYLNWWSEYIT
ncbi:HNH endonuclease [Paenibacillus sp. HGF7]|uniref:HNH endonuclease n=1 Tax=Paenibacillus sp. HGF7 TaxID=944559 RepID=UPI000A05F65B